MRVSLSRDTPVSKLRQFCEVVKAGGLHTLKSVLHPSSSSDSKHDCFCDVNVDILVLLGKDVVFFYEDCLVSDAGLKSYMENKATLVNLKSL